MMNANTGQKDKIMKYTAYCGNKQIMQHVLKILYFLL